MKTSKPKVIAGWRLFPLRIIFLLSMFKYVFQRKKYPLFRWNSLQLLKSQKMLALTKVVKLAHHYYAAIMRVPHWPSKAFDHMAGSGGFDIRFSGTPKKEQIDVVILAITQKCQYMCMHCYERENLSEEETVPIDKWKDIVKQLQNKGVSIFCLSGGEPFLRFEGLMALLESGDKRLSDFHIHTSGHGATLEKALALKKAGLQAAGISLDDYNPERHDAFRGYKGAYRDAVQAIKCFRQVGVYTYTNVCLRKDLIKEQGLWRYFQLAKDLNVGTINLLEPKPCGGLTSKDVDSLFSEEDRIQVTNFYREANQTKKYRDYPLVSYMSFLEKSTSFGCLMGGLSHFYINSRGDVEPCVYLPVSFGNIMEEEFSAIMERMRQAVPFPFKGECPAMCLAEKVEIAKIQGSSYPVPFERIESDWQKLFI